MRSREWIVGAACLISGLAAFAATGSNGFVYDKDVAQLAVRPLVLAAVGLERALLGPQPSHFHWIDLLFHVAASWSLGILVMRWASSARSGPAPASPAPASPAATITGATGSAGESRAERRARARAEAKTSRRSQSGRGLGANQAGLLLGGLVAALLATLHPLRGEAVLHVLGRGESMATLFSVWAVLHLWQDGWRRWLVPFWTAAAIASSPYAALLVPLAWWVGPMGRWKGLPWVVPGAVAAGVSILVSARSAQWPAPSVADNPLVGADLLTRLSTAAVTHWQHLRAYLWPFPLAPDRSYSAWDVVPLTSAPALVSLAGLLLAGVAVAKAGRPLRRWAASRTARHIAGPSAGWRLGLLWTAFGLVFASNLLWLTESGFAARASYVAGSGLFLVLGSLTARVLGHRSWRALPTAAFATVVGALVVAFVSVGLQRTPIWKSNLSLFDHVTNVQPDGFRGWYELGRACLTEAEAASSSEDSESAAGDGAADSADSSGAPDSDDSTDSPDPGEPTPDQWRTRAERAFHRSVEIFGDENPAWASLTRLYYEDAQYDSAMWAAERLRHTTPQHRDGFLAFAEGLVSLGQLDAALEEAQRGLVFHPSEARLHEVAARVLRRQEDVDASIPAYLEAARLDPEWVMPRERVGFMLMQAGRWGEAIGVYRELQALDPGAENANALAWSLLEHIRASAAAGSPLEENERTELLEESVRLAQQAADATLGEDRKHVEDTLAQALWELGRHEEAILVLQRVVRNYRVTDVYRERLEQYLAEHPVD